MRTIVCNSGPTPASTGGVGTTGSAIGIDGSGTDGSGSAGIGRVVATDEAGGGNGAGTERDGGADGWVDGWVDDRADSSVDGVGAAGTTVGCDSGWTGGPGAMASAASVATALRAVLAISAWLR